MVKELCQRLDPKKVYLEVIGDWVLLFSVQGLGFHLVLGSLDLCWNGPKPVRSLTALSDESAFSDCSI